MRFMSFMNNPSERTHVLLFALLISSIIYVNLTCFCNYALSSLASVNMLFVASMVHYRSNLHSAPSLHFLLRFPMQIECTLKSLKSNFTCYAICHQHKLSLQILFYIHRLESNYSAYSHSSEETKRKNIQISHFKNSQ